MPGGRRCLIALAACWTLFACTSEPTGAGGNQASEANGGEDGLATTPPDILLDPDHADWSEESPDSFRARFETNEGPFVIEVHRTWSPRGADHFYNLVRHGFYDDQRFSRVVEGFITQWGLSGDPEVTRAWKGRTIPDDPVVASNLRGYISYAMTGPDTRSTQVYISMVDNTRLDRQGFSPLGQVVEGMEVVDRLYSGYGEDAGGGMRAGNQGPVEEGGTAYLVEHYPELDFVIQARIESGS